MLAVLAILIILIFFGLFVLAWVICIAQWWGRHKARGRAYAEAHQKEKQKRVNLGF